MKHFPLKKMKKLKKKNFKILGPLPGTPGVPHIWAPRPKFQKPLGYPTQNPLKGYHAKFQSIRSSSFLWRRPGYEKVTGHFLLWVHLYNVNLKKKINAVNVWGVIRKKHTIWDTLINKLSKLRLTRSVHHHCTHLTLWSAPECRGKTF